MSKNILIFGGTSHIAKIIYSNLLKKNNVISVSSSKKRMDQLKKKYKNSDNFYSFYFDYELKNLKNLVLFFKKNNFKELSILYLYRNNKNYENDNFNLWNNELKDQITLPYFICKKLDKNFNIKKFILISSIYSDLLPPKKLHKNIKNFPINYSVAKAGVEKLTMYMAELYKFPVFCIKLGGVEGRANRKFLNKYKQHTIGKSMLTKNDLNKIFEDAFENENGYITGRTLQFDYFFRS